MSGPPDLSSATLELLYRYAHGHFSPTVRQRLAEIFATNPPDAIERLERAAAYLGVDGSELLEWAERPLPDDLGYASSRPAD